MIDSIIISRALQQTSKLTLPSFGTLLKKDNGDIFFSQFLKNDDMVFTSIIMNSYNVSTQEASQMVSDFVLTIVSKISKGESFFIPEVGYLYLDSSGATKINKENPAPQIQQPRQPITPRPIVGVPQQPVQQPMQQQVIPNVPPRPYPQGVSQLRQQPPYGPRPQGIPQRPQGIPQRPQGVPQRPQQFSQPRPTQRQDVGMGAPRSAEMGQGHPRVKKQKNAQKIDLLLLIAIIVIVLIIGLIIYSTFFTETISDLM